MKAEEARTASEEMEKPKKNKTLLIERIFGKEATSNVESQPGELVFHSADLLAQSARATSGMHAYYLITTHGMLSLHNQRSEALNISVVSLKGIQFNMRYRFTNAMVSVENIPVAGVLSKDHPVAELIDQETSRVIILTEDDYKELQLPVVARNNLSDKRNLWFEEYVPHQSVFAFAVAGSQDLLDDFDSVINGQVVQFGGNASIGFGLMKIARIGG